MEIKENELIEKINENIPIIQSKDGFRFAIDSILLANFFQKENTKSVKLLDIGTGNGVIPFLIYENNLITEITAVDIQDENIVRAKKIAELNSCTKQKINFIKADIKEFKKGNYFDAIISNPPYIKTNGKINENNHKAISKHEIYLNLEEFIENSKRLLKPIGELYFIYRSFRLVEVIKTLDKNNFSIDKILFFYNNKNETKLMCVKAIKGKKVKLKIENCSIEG